LILVVLGQIVGILRIFKAIADDVELLKTPNLTSAGETAIYLELALNCGLLALVAVTTTAMW
jgi:hypothetical protein